MAPAFKWTAAEERRLLLALLQHFLDARKKLNDADYQALLSAWPSDPASKGLSGTPTLRGIKDRTRDLRRHAADLFANGNPSDARVNVQVPSPLAAPRPFKHEHEHLNDQATSPSDSSAAEPAGEDYSAGTIAATTPQTAHKPHVNKKIISTPTSRKSAAAASLPTSATSTRPGTGNKLKRARAAGKSTLTNANADSSDEALSTDDCGDDEDETGPNSPTPAAKKPRTTYNRATKPQAQGVFSSFDGPNSGDESEVESDGVKMALGSGLNKQWAGIMSKRAIKKRIHVTRDDSDQDWQDSELELMD